MITQILAAQLCHGNGRGISQPVDFVYHDGVDPPGADVGEQTLQTWPLDGAAREPAIVVASSGRYPSLVTLAADGRVAALLLRSVAMELSIYSLLEGAERATGSVAVIACVTGERPAATSPVRSVTHLGWQQEGAPATRRSSTGSRLDASSA